jgi:hypothetical protein
MMVPPKVSRSTMAAQSLGSVKVLVQPEKDSLDAIGTNAFYLPVPQSPIKHGGWALLDPLALGQGVDDRGIDAGVGLEVEAA